MYIINDNTFNLHHSLLNNDSWYMKVTLKTKLIGDTGEFKKIFLVKKKLRLICRQIWYFISQLEELNLHLNLSD